MKNYELGNAAGLSRAFATSIGMSMLIAFVSPAQALNSITVVSTADSGPGSLREAILTANTDGDATVIDFDSVVFPANPPGIINLLSRLPVLAAPNTTIDASGAGVVVDGSGLGGTDQGFRVRASGTIVRGVSVRNFPGDGIRIQPSGSNEVLTNVVIQGNTVAGNLDGISVSGGNQNNTVSVSVLSNTLDRNEDDGILVRGSFSTNTDGHNDVTVLIDGNTVHTSQGVVLPGFSGDGIRVESGCGDSLPNVTKATISNNTIQSSADQGILAKGAGCGNGQTSNNQIHADIIGNNIRNSGLAVDDFGVPLGGSGISVAGGHRVGTTGGNDNIVTFLISGNTVTGSTQHGIVATGGGGTVAPTGGGHQLTGTISGNLVRKHAEHGIVVSGGRTDFNHVSVTVQDNDLKDSGRDGIRVSGGQGDNNTVDEISITGNTTRNNMEDGIGVSLGSGIGNVVSLAEILNNTSIRNIGDGIHVRSGIDGDGATPISANDASRNNQDGIDIDSSGYVLNNNTADRNGGDGINAVGNVDGGGNSAKGNASCNTPDFNVCM